MMANLKIQQGQLGAKTLRVLKDSDAIFRILRLELGSLPMAGWELPRLEMLGRLL
jgi:hypothetical protein